MAGSGDDVLLLVSPSAVEQYGQIGLGVDGGFAESPLLMPILCFFFCFAFVIAAQILLILGSRSSVNCCSRRFLVGAGLG